MSTRPYGRRPRFLPGVYSTRMPSVDEREAARRDYVALMSNPAADDAGAWLRASNVVSVAVGIADAIAATLGLPYVGGARLNPLPKENPRAWCERIVGVISDWREGRGQVEQVEERHPVERSPRAAGPSLPEKS